MIFNRIEIILIFYHNLLHYVINLQIVVSRNFAPTCFVLKIIKYIFLITKIYWDTMNPISNKLHLFSEYLIFYRMLTNFRRTGCNCLWRHICHVWPQVPWPVTRACSPAGRHIQYVCRTKDRSCVKRSKARQPRATEPGRLSISMSRGEFATVNGVRHRAVSFCRGALFLPTVPLSSYPKDLKAHLLGKLPCFVPLARSTNYQSDGASSLFFAIPLRHEHVGKLNFIS